jgi:ABC-type amino acid transport substrate-binding protein
MHWGIYEGIPQSYVLKESEYTSMNAWRYTYQLIKNDNDAPNIVWLPASKELDQKLRPIPIPILKGLLGIRVLLIKQEDQDRFYAIKSKEDLKALTAGQGATWSDVEILRANGFTVETGFDYQGLFNMLEYRRFDFFPRGVNEVLREFNTLPSNLTDIAIEKSIVLQYPYPVYFYVNKNNEKLAKRVEKGLNIMLKDGSLDEILNDLYQNSISALNIPNRKVISLDNPLLTEEQQKTFPDFWFKKLYILK